jgi:hypothetical protein
MHYYDLIELAEIKAINSAIFPSTESIYRLKCRQYSEAFFTPLDRVYDLDPQLVLQALYESKYPPSVVENELEELIETLKRIEDPRYTRVSQEEIEDLVDAAINNLNRIKGKKKTVIEESLLDKDSKELKKQPIPPKQGSMSFENLQQLEESSENNTKGFRD